MTPSRCIFYIYYFRHYFLSTFFPLDIMSQSAFIIFDIISGRHFLPFDIMSQLAFIIFNIISSWRFLLFDVFSHLVFFYLHSYVLLSLFTIQRVVLSIFFTIQCFLLTFCPIWRFIHQCFFYHRCFLFRHFVSESQDLLKTFFKLKLVKAAAVFSVGNCSFWAVVTGALDVGCVVDTSPPLSWAAEASWLSSQKTLLKSLACCDS